jgi:hypothetical protein
MLTVSIRDFDCDVALGQGKTLIDTFADASLIFIVNDKFINDDINVMTFGFLKF